MKDVFHPHLTGDNLANTDANVSCTCKMPFCGIRELGLKSIKFYGFTLRVAPSLVKVYEYKPDIR